MNKILIISVAGIGNTLMATPLIESLKRGIPDSKIDVLVAQRGSSEVLQNNPFVNDIFFVTKKFFKRLFTNLKVLFKLRANRYDISILAFPANRAEFNLISYFVHAKQRLAHSYALKNICSLSFLNNKKIPMEKIFDINQNLNLLDVLGIKPISKSMKIWLSDEDKKFAEDFIQKNNLENEKLIGIHAGCSPDQPYKKWPEKKFAGLINLLQKKGYAIILCGGPSDKQIIKNISSLVEGCLIVDNAKMTNAAALIKKCSLFISNDSGLMHVAVAVGVPVAAIYGASDPRRTAPYFDFKNIIRTNLGCQPCDRTLHNIGKKFKCIYGKDYQCLNKLSVDEVFDSIRERI